MGRRFVIPQLFITGIIAGVMSGFLGIGGGIIMIPCMVMVLGIPMQTAVGVSLAVIIPTAVMGCLRHHALGNVDWSVFLPLALGAVVGALLGVEIVRLVPAEIAKRIFGILLVVVGLQMAFGRNLVEFFRSIISA